MLGAALRAHHAGGARAGALAERARLDEHDALEAAALEEPGAPGADGAAADDDDVGGARQAGRAGHATYADID